MRQCHRKRNRSSTYPFPAPPQDTAETMHHNGGRGLKWNKATVTDFRLVGLAAVETEAVPAGQVGWIANNTGAWYEELSRVAITHLKLH